MRASKTISKWDIVVVPFPYADQLAEKRRPALVVSDSYLRSFGLVWVMMITSASNSRWKCDVDIPDLKRAGLPVASVVRPAKIATIDPGRIAGRIGKLSQSAARAVEQQLHQILA